MIDWLILRVIQKKKTKLPCKRNYNYFNGRLACDFVELQIWTGIRHHTVGTSECALACRDPRHWSDYSSVCKYYSLCPFLESSVHRRYASHPIARVCSYAMHCTRERQKLATACSRYRYELTTLTHHWRYCGKRLANVQPTAVESFAWKFPFAPLLKGFRGGLPPKWGLCLGKCRR